MECVVFFVLAAGALSSGQELGARVDSESVGRSLHSGIKTLDPLAYSLGGSAVKNPRRTRRTRSALYGRRGRDLFGFFEDDYIGNAPLSSYTGEILPFWTFKTNNNFVFSSKNSLPRERRKATHETSWSRVGPVRYQVTEDVMEAAGTELVEEEADPEPPKRDEEFISEHEIPRDVPTRPKYGVPGGWAKGEVPGKKQVDLGFVPVQVYSQVRRYDSEEHLPRERAAEEADTQEEVLAAPRLREVLRNKKLHEVYEEEGYEDLGYDHGGYNHQGVKVEGAVKNEHGAYRKVPPSAPDTVGKASITIRVLSPGDDAEQAPAKEDSVDTNSKERERHDITTEPSHLDASTPKVEVSGRRIVVDGRKGPTLKNTLRDTVKQNLTIYVPDNINMADRMDIQETRPQDALEARVVNNPRQKVTFPGKSSRRHYTSWVNPIVVTPDVYEENESVQKPQMVNVHEVAAYVPSPYYYETSPQSAKFSSSSPVQFASAINTYASLINQNFSAPLLRDPQTLDDLQSTFKTSDEYAWAQSNHHERRVKSDGSGADTKPGVTEINEKMDVARPEGFSHKKHDEVSENSRKQSTRQSTRRRGNNSRSGNTNANNKNANGNLSEIDVQTPAPTDTSTSQTRTSNRKTLSSAAKREKVYSNFTRGNVKYNPEDQDSQWTPTVGTLNIRHPSLPFDTSGDKSDGVTKPINPNAETPYPSPTQSMPSILINIPTQAAPVATKDPSANAKYVEQLTLAHFSAPVNIYPQQPHLMSQDERLKELAKELNAPQEEDEEIHLKKRTKRSTIVYSKEKYPHYESPPSISKDSALKYATNPAMVPKKTYGGMEFYESKENIKCNGPDPPKNVTPQKEGDGEWESDPVPDGPRVKGVGKTIDCYKKKFFGKDPLDNPFFKEEVIESPDKVEDTTPIEDNISSGRSPGDPRTVELLREERQLKLESSNATKSALSSVSSDSEEVGEEEEAEDEGEEEEEESTSAEEDSPSYINTSQTSQEYSPGNSSASSQPEYSVYESSSYEDSLPISTTEQPTLKYNHYHSLHPSKPKYQLQKKKKYTPQVIQPISVYSIISTNDIPPHHAPLLIPQTNPDILPIPSIKSSFVSYSPAESSNIPHQIYPLPNHYKEEKVIVRKREVGDDFWGAMNPLRWWWPTLFDSRREEPRYRRSTERKMYDLIISNADRSAANHELSSQGSEVVEVPVEMKPSTSAPLTLAEFKAKFNIPDSKRTPESPKRVTRLTGGFLNRNPEITDHILELLDGEPTESSTGSTIATTTLKPKVIFPRAKLPRRITYAPKKQSTYSADITTEATTTTTTTTQAPSTTTRMYKPKRVIKKNYGKGPFDAFTILKNQRELTTQNPFQNTEVPEMSNRSDEPERENPKRVQQVEHRRTTKEEVFKTTYVPEETVGEPKIAPPDPPQDNDTLTYMVNPITGVGSWGEQRKWKPKRKRPDTPSIYSYRNGGSFKKDGPTRKKQRDIPDRNREVYIAGLMSRMKPVVPSKPPTEEHTRHDYDEESLERKSREEERTVVTEQPVSSTTRSSKPPPKYILEPDKRRYYYAKGSPSSRPRFRPMAELDQTVRSNPVRPTNSTS